jgi:undecaprenyl-diphosphatase
MPRAERAFPLRHAVALGLLQGPTELLPVSSSGHTSLVPWLAGWQYAQLGGGRRKAFELALHTGAGLALALDMRAQARSAGAGAGADADAGDRRRRAAVLALSLAPPALAGTLLRDRIERRLGGPRSIAAGLAAGAVAMAAADRLAPARRSSGEAGAADGLALGIAQALALIPGVSRSGATLTAARARGFARADARELSRLVALPVILGAGAQQGLRLARGGIPPGSGGELALGGLAAFGSTLVAAQVLRRGGYGERALLPYSLYRCLLAALVVARLRRAPGAR